MGGLKAHVLHISYLQVASEFLASTAAVQVATHNDK